MGKKPAKPRAAAAAVSTRRYHIPSLERALGVMECLAKEPQGLGISDLASRLGVPKNSVFRIATTLVAHGYLHRDAEGKKLTLGRKILALGYSAVDEYSLVEKSLDVMRALRDETAETVLLGTLLDDQGVVLEQVPSDQPVKFVIELGHRFPLHSAAPGKAILAYLPDPQLSEILSRMRFTRFNERTITSRSAYERELGQVRQNGYALDRGEEIKDVHCVAAPILNHRGHPVAAAWVTGPAFRLPQQDLPRVAPQVVRAARQISQRFGYQLLDEG